MASNFESVQHASDLIHDFVCSPCKDDGLNNEAQFFCNECKKYYCNNCVLLHNKLFRTHTVLGRQDVSKWVGYAGLSPTETCDKHGDKKLELLCEDHDELCCHICVSLTHRMCQSIKHVPDLAYGLKKQTDYIQLPPDVQNINHRLQEITKKRTHNKQSLKDSGKTLLAEIKSLRKKVNDKFDEIEKKTNDILQEQLHEVDDFLQEDINKCTQLTDTLNTCLKIISPQQDDNTFFIAFKKCKHKMREAENMLQELSIKPDISLTFQADPGIKQFLSRLNTLGKIEGIPGKDPYQHPNFVFTTKNSLKYSVKLLSDSECKVNGICEMPGGEILITDNSKLKLLNSHYQVASCKLIAAPNHVCHIAGNEAAVTLGAGNKGVHFITVTGGTISIKRQLTFPHFCFGITHHNGNLYVGSLTAIYQYTMSGQLVKMIYEDNSARVTVGRFTVSRDGTNIYIPALHKNKLITINTSGNILSTLQDPDFDLPISVCVSDGGHVFVCSQMSQKVTQVDKEGKCKLASLADVLYKPCAVLFTRHSIIVGGRSNEISVFELK